MKAMRKGSALLIEARMRVYDAALTSGKSSAEAHAIARKIAPKHITGVRTDTPSAIISRAIARANQQEGAMWMPAKDAPDGLIVMTKIDDAKGCRNQAALRRQGRLWWTTGRRDVCLLHPDALPTSDGCGNAR